MTPNQDLIRDMLEFIQGVSLCGDPEHLAERRALHARAKAALAAPAPRARLLVTMNEGLVETVAAEGLDEVQLELVQIDFDTEGCEEGEGPIRVDGELMFVSVGEVEKMSPDEAALARTARDTWAMTP